MILESELAGLCAERITAEELDEMELLVEAMKMSVHDAAEFSKLDLSFHLAMGTAAKNEVLNSILSGVREKTMELIAKSLLLDEGMETALRGHIKVLEALLQHNAAKAREAMHNHLQSFQRGYNVLFEERSRNSKP